MNREDGMLVCEGTMAVGNGRAHRAPAAGHGRDRRTGVASSKLHAGDIIGVRRGVLQKQQEERLNIMTEPMDWYSGNRLGWPCGHARGYVGLLYGRAIRSLRLDRAWSASSARSKSAT
jgi:hypothetical protein